jgi:hypothetical protein
MNMLSAKWVQRDGETIAVSPADECVSFLSHPSRVNGIKSKGMRAKHDIKALVSCNNFASYTMGDVPPILDYKLVLPMGKFNGLRVHYNIRMDPDLGVGWAALCRVACGCGPCKNQLERPWVLLVEPATQPRYAQSKECVLWPSYKSANDWKCCALVAKNGGRQNGGTEVNPFCPQRVQGAHFPHCAHGQGWCGRHDRQGGRWQLPVC